MRSRWRDLLGAAAFAGALLTLFEPRWRLAMLRLVTLLAPSIGRRYGLVPRSAFLFTLNRLLDAPDGGRSAAASPPSLFRLLIESGVRSIRRAFPGRGRWGLRERRD